ncbi:MAG: carbohydrate ABC transporter permease [Anaerobacillus sp.]|uniref:carbohydrate ABC transporter permease n=1 Tax=Anaerobacillus sp. TaxID=1872506 RepID=UPI00391B0586
MAIIQKQAQTIAQKKKISFGKKKSWDKLVPYMFISPFIFTFFVFFLFPSIYSFVLSFYRYRGYGEARFVGIDNYLNLLQYPTFWTAVYNTMFYLVIHIFPVMIISFLLAVAMNSKFIKWQKVYKPLIFLPQIMAVVAAALVFRILFSTRTGVINNVFGTQIPFLEDPSLMKWTVVILIVWRAVGWFLVIFLAGLTTISPSLNEAAEIDGANAFQRLWYITIPLMKPILLFAFVIDTIGSLKIYAEPLILISGWINAPTHVIPIMALLTNNLQGGNFGMASAVGWVLFLMILVVSAIQFKLFKGWGRE